MEYKAVMKKHLKISSKYNIWIFVEGLNKIYGWHRLKNIRNSYKKNGMNYDCLVAASTILKFSPLVLALSMPSEHTNTVFFF